MNNSHLKEISHEYTFIKEIQIDDGILEAWRINNIADLEKIAFPALILFSKCAKHNEFGACISEIYLTVKYINNCKQQKNSDAAIIDEADRFYILHSYPFIEDQKNRILQLFATNSKTDLLKYPVKNPFENHNK